MSTDTATELTERDHAMLELERKWWKYPAAKQQHVREQFSMTIASYYQALNVLIDRPEALAYDAPTVNRLRRLRAMRQQRRTSRRVGFDL